jgi:hypothetical protein
MSNLIWAQNILERVDNGESVSEADLSRASEIVMGEVNKHKPRKKKETLPKFAKNQVELAKCFQVDRKTIQRWRKEEGFPPPVSNGKWDVEATHAWIKENHKIDVHDEDDLHELKIRQLRLICEKLEHELKVKREDYTLNEEVQRWVSQMVHEAKVVLLGIPAKLAPAVAGLEPAEAEARIKEEIDIALNQLHDG